MFVVAVNHLGTVYTISNTILTSFAHKSSRFATQEAAVAGIAKAKKFGKASVFKNARIVAIDEAAITLASGAYEGDLAAAKIKFGHNPPTLASNEALRLAYASCLDRYNDAVTKIIEAAIL